MKCSVLRGMHQKIIRDLKQFDLFDCRFKVDPYSIHQSLNCGSNQMKRIRLDHRTVIIVSSLFNFVSRYDSLSMMIEYTDNVCRNKINSYYVWLFRFPVELYDMRGESCYEHNKAGI